jgi:hypothetical protein
MTSFSAAIAGVAPPIHPAIKVPTIIKRDRGILTEGVENLRRQ